MGTEFLLWNLVKFHAAMHFLGGCNSKLPNALKLVLNYKRTFQAPIWTLGISYQKPVKSLHNLNRRETMSGEVISFTTVEYPDESSML